MRIAFAGNPNSGKTTMYNALTGGSERVGNWAGVTVDKKEGIIKKSFYGGVETLIAVDLPVDLIADFLLDADVFVCQHCRTGAQQGKHVGNRFSFF